jgi:hypothetical protein
VVLGLELCKHIPETVGHLVHPVKGVLDLERVVVLVPRARHASVDRTREGAAQSGGRLGRQETIDDSDRPHRMIALLDELL